VTELKIRTATTSDAAAFLDLWDALDTETQFMLFEPNERKITLENQKSRLAESEQSNHVRILVLKDSTNNLLAGFCAGRRSQLFRDKHSLHIVIGMRQAYTGKAWGRKLLAELERWAIDTKDILRLELSVMENNTRAISLYSSLGFEIEGTKRNSVCLRSGYVNEHIMAKLIG